MNSTPNTTGSVAITAGMLSTVIIWLCGVVNIPAPPDAVAAALAALVMYAAHQVGVMMSRPAGAAGLEAQSTTVLSSSRVMPPAPVAPPAPPAQ